ncbi:hypothetical protein L9G16_11710 [Shewanella sp. A25]|nr:hypothetical protein [Shewanella shenzhenensis]
MILRVFLVFITLIMTGCASGPREPTYVSFDSKEAQRISNFNIDPYSNFAGQISIAPVQIASEQFAIRAEILTKDIEFALNDVRLIAPAETGSFLLVSTLTNLEFDPGLSMSPHISMNYQLVDKRDNQVIYNNLIRTIGTAQFSEAFMGTERNGIALGRAMNVNLAQLIEELNTLARKY